MMAEQANLIERLVSCFLEDPLIDEYDFVLLPQTGENDQPFLLENHKLALATAILKPLFLEAQRQLQNIQTSTSFNSTEDKAWQIKHATQTLLMINPDAYTAWNLRKGLLGLAAAEQGGGEERSFRCLSEEEEIKFLDLIFSRHSKKPSAWAHRRWCIERLLGIHRGGKMEERLIQHELKVTAEIALRHPKNYYAWTHRWWLVSSRVGITTPIQQRSLLQEQMRFAQAWVEEHVWDMSAINYLHQVVCLLLDVMMKSDDGTDAAVAMLIDLLQRGVELLYRYPGHDSLWYQRRGLIALLIRRHHREDLKDLYNRERIRFDHTSTYPRSSLSEILAWELDMSEWYYQRASPLHEQNDNNNILWDEASATRQRHCAWAYQCWIIKQLHLHQLRPWREKLLQMLASLHESPPGYRALLI